MSVAATPAEPAPGPAAAAAGAAGMPRAPQLALLIAGSLLVVVALVWIGYEVAAARVPQHRAALEELIRHETGLEVTFNELALRWGWYGPEAVFRGVELGEPGGRGTRLRAVRLIVGLDLWRLARSGRLEAARIRLENPDVDLATGLRPARSARAGPGVWSTGARLLARWRGGRIDIDGGTLRALPPAGTEPVTFSIRQARLERRGDDWSAQALVLLPDSLGASARLTLEYHGDPALPEISSATLHFEGQRLQFAGLRALASEALPERVLPHSGSGNVELVAAFAHGRIASVSGELRARSLEWRAHGARVSALVLERVSGNWRLARRGREWQLAVDSLALEVPATPAGRAATPATILLTAASDGSYAHGNAQHAPLAALAAIARWCAPQLPLAELALGGEARELTVDWSEERPPGGRLVLAADVRDLTIAAASGELSLSGLNARVAGAETRLIADLDGPDARLTLAGQADGLERLAIRTRLSIDLAGGGWHVGTDRLEITRPPLAVALSGALGSDAPAAPRWIDAHLTLRDADLALLGPLLGPHQPGSPGVAARLRAGRIEQAELAWRGPLAGEPPWSAPFTHFSGALALRGVRLSASGDWPDTDDIDARIDWRGPRFHALVEHGRSGSFRLTGASANWDARGLQPLRLTAHLAGSAPQALAWLRQHPQLAAWAPGVSDVDLRGETRLDLDVTAASSSAPQVRVAALLEAAELRALAGLPPIHALRGTVAFAGGHLQHSTLSGQWLGGPVTLTIVEQREHGAALAIAGRGLLDARQAVQAAGGNADAVPLAGHAEWSAQLLLPAAKPQERRWSLRADSSLVGVASALPEPLGKTAGAVLPLHLELQGESGGGRLHLSLAERLRAVAAFSRSGDAWRLERAAVRVAGAVPALPAERAIVLDGRVNRLDLASALAGWRAAGADAALPALRARLEVARLALGGHSYPDVSVLAQADGGGASLALESASLAATARWPAVLDASHPAVVRLAGFNLAQPADTALSAGLATVLAPAVQLAVDDLRWRGRSLGSLSARLVAQSEALAVTDVRLTGASGETRGEVHCQTAACAARFSLDTPDAATTLAAFGLRPEIRAGRGHLDGELQWSPEARVPLATLAGHLHMELDDGTTVAAATGGEPFALLAVPALIAGLGPELRVATQSGLRFARLTADYELRDGAAQTADLHFDGDAEILLRGRVGLVARDYDGQAWILRGEQRLPAAVRRLDSNPKVAALWLWLRDWLAPGRAASTLHLRGSWNDPIVTTAE